MNSLKSVSIKIGAVFDQRLNAIVEQRKAQGRVINTKKGVIESLIYDAYKKEVNQKR